MELSNTPKVCKGLLYALYLGLELFSWICVSLFHTRLGHICRIKLLDLLFHFGPLGFRSNLSHRDSNQDLRVNVKNSSSAIINCWVFYIYMNSIFIFNVYSLLPISGLLKLKYLFTFRIWFSCFNYANSYIKYGYFGLDHIHVNCSSKWIVE